MFWISFLVTALLVAGIILAFGIDKQCISEFWSSTRFTVTKRIKKSKNREKHISLRRKTELLINGKKQNFMVRTFKETEAILAETHQRHRIKGIYFFSAIFAALGLVISIAALNVFIAFPLTLGAALVPAWIVKLTSSRAKKQLNADLEVALSGITTSYVRSDNILLAVKENICYLNGIIKTVFVKFVKETEMVRFNAALNIQKMKSSIDNETFREWCDILYQCQTDSSLKAALFPIINRFSETKGIQTELDTIMMAPFKETIMIVVMVILSIPLMALINREWFETLINTIPGQIIMSIALSVIVFALNKSVQLTSPLKRGEK